MALNFGMGIANAYHEIGDQLGKAIFGITDIAQNFELVQTVNDAGENIYRISFDLKMEDAFDLLKERVSPK